MNAAPSLKRLPLAAFPPPGQPTSDRDGAAAAAQRPAQLTRATVRLVFATRAHVSKLAAVEQELLRAAGKDARDPPSVLRGAVVRYMSQGRHRLDLVAGTAVDAQGALALRLAAFCKLVPVACLSASSPLDDDAAWEGGGGKEVAELAQALASRLPTCSEVATACCRLSLGWLWAGQLGAVKAAAQADLAGVAALLDDGVAVAAVLPCVVPPMSLPATLQKPAAAAQPKPALASPPQQQHEQEQQMPRWQQQPPQQQPPQQPPQQRDVMPSPKRQRIDGGSAVGREPKPGELPDPGLSASPAAQAAQQSPGPSPPVQDKSTVAEAAQPPQPLVVDRAVRVMAPGGPLEALLLASVAEVDSTGKPGSWHACSMLGSMLAKHNKNWRTEFRAGSVKLTELVLALQRRGYVQAEQHLTTKGTVYWRRLDAPGCLRPVGGGASRKHTPAFLPPLQHTSQLKPASAFPQQQHVDAVPPWQQQRQEQQQHQQQALPPWPWQQQQQQQPQRPPLPQVPSQPCATSLRSSPPLPSAAVPKLPGSSAPLSLAVLPLPQLPPQQQQQQLQQQPEALPAAKRQRTDDGEGSSDGELEPGELVQEAGAALPALMAKQQQRPGAPARSQAPQAAGQRAEGATPSGQAPPAQKQPPAGSGQLRKAREHMPPGGALEALLLQLVADADRAEPGCWHTIGALGTMIGKHNSQWKSLAIPSATGVPKLQRLVTVLQERGHVEAEVRWSGCNVLWWRRRSAPPA